MKTSSLSFVAAALVGLAILQPVARANLVTNPGFETGNFAGWTVSAVDTTFVVVSPLATHTGSWGAFLGPFDPSSISQSLPTVSGAMYGLNFWLANTTGVPNAFQVLWDGVVVVDLVNAPTSPYTQFSVANLVATSTSTSLSFVFSNTPGYWMLDDIAVLETANPPPPPPDNRVPDGGITALLLGSSLIGLVALRRRSR